MRKTKEVRFSQARQNLTAIVDEVEKTGQPVTIIRHGKAVAVLVGVREYEARLGETWTLAGSLQPVGGVEVEKALNDLSRKRAEHTRRRLPHRTRSG